MKCPKCQYERKAGDLAPPTECPECGVIYARYRKPGEPRPKRPVHATHPVDTPDPNHPPTTQTKIPAFVIPLVIGLAVGFFAGREHIKYEMRQAFAGAVENVKTSIASAFSGAPASASVKERIKKPVRLDVPPSFTVALTSKGFQAADYQNDIDAANTFALRFGNLTGKDVRAFDGKLTFTDLLDNKILSANLAINDPVSAGSAVEWSGGLDYNQFMDRHQRLKIAEFKNMKVQFNTKKILFSDGSVTRMDK